MSPAATRNGPKLEWGINTTLYVCIHPNNQTAPIDVLLQSFLVFDLSATVIIVYTHTIELIGLAESLENAQVREGHMTRYR